MAEQNKFCKAALEELCGCQLRQTAMLNISDRLRALDLQLEQTHGAREQTALAKQRNRLFAELQVLRLETGRCARAFSELGGRERYVLEHMYVLKEPVFDIMEALTIEKSAFYRLRRRALRTFVRALYGIDPYEED